MKKDEFEKRIKTEGLLEVFDEDIRKIYISPEKVVRDGEWISNETNVYGCYKGPQSYVIFMTDAERGISYWGRSYDSEDDAYNALYDYLILLDKIYKEDHGVV